MYALGFNITKKICMANGQQEEEGKKMASFDEVVTMVNAALKTPENHGNYHDYIELCKLYDKNENGTMMLAELENILSNLGKFFPLVLCESNTTHFYQFLSVDLRCILVQHNLLFYFRSWWNPQGRHSCPSRWIGRPRRWRRFLPIHPIRRPIVRQGLSFGSRPKTQHKTIKII